MSHANLSVFACCDFYGWTLPSLGLSIDMNLRRSPGAPRWFAISAGLLFLHVKLRIESENVPPVDEEDADD